MARGPDPRLWAMRTAFRAVGHVAPGVAARVAEEIFCRPPRPPTGSNESRILEGASAFSVDSPSGRLAAWEWGAGPVVLLTHGWGSRAARLAPLIDALVAGGFRVVAYDNPAHGLSAGRRASLPEFARALRAVSERVGPARAVVGHSLGGAAAALALHAGLPAERAVLIAAPADVAIFTEAFGSRLAIPRRALSVMYRNLERRLDMRWDRIRLTTLAPEIAVPALIVHDSDDGDVPLTDARAIAASWPSAELVTTSGLGHRGVLRDPAVAARVVEFLAG